MALKPGTQVGAYEITAPLGAGGMGEVYRATDTKLKREVAIKVLPEDVAGDSERLARFEREAHVLASLNHPHIASIYGLEESGGVPCLVLELVEGQTLAERLAEGALSVKNALEIARQIASALEAAHEKGVIHRDLKPANVKITPKGSVKVLDFGLAKALADESMEISGDPAHSPTLTAATRAGVILGTAAYMSPEQARGKPVDKRTDIWAFGCILFEILTAKPAFSGQSVTDVLAEVLKADPAWNLLPDNTPVEILRMIRRCLVKSRRDRLHDVADVRVMLDDAAAELSAPGMLPTLAHQEAKSRARLRFGLVSLTMIAVAALIVGVLAGRFVGSSSERTRGSFSIELPEGLTLPLDPCVPFALSPDGTQLVFVGLDGADRRLYRRELDSFEVESISGTEGAMGPAFSPDGRWIAFVDRGTEQLKKVTATGGASLPLGAATSNTKGLHWGTEDRLVLTPSYMTGLSILDVETGAVILETQPESETREKTHRYPHMLPGGDAILFMRGTDDLYSYDDAEIELLDLSSGARRQLIKGGAHPTYVPTGHILFVRDGALLAAPLNLRRAELTGPVVKVLDGVTFDPGSGNGFYATSPAGHLAYLPGGPEMFDQELVYVDRTGKAEPSGLDSLQYARVVVSPSGRELALEIWAANDNVWVHDLERGALTRLTTTGDNTHPVWTPDGQKILCNSRMRTGAGAVTDVVAYAADGSGDRELVIENGVPLAWARRGKQLAFGRDDDIWVRDPDKGAEPMSFVATRFNESVADFSPDGRWLAYVSDESERPEVYVVPYPGKGKRWQISAAGGGRPRWSHDGGELYYLQGQTMMVVSVMTAPEFSVSSPRLLFELDPRYVYRPEFDVFPDGRFAMIRGEKKRRTRIRVVLHWLDQLRDQQ